MPKAERGRPTEATVDGEVQGIATRLPQNFGSLNAVSFVPGAEIIKMQNYNDPEDGEKEEYESCSDISDDDEFEDWVDVVHSDEDDEEAEEDLELRDPVERCKRAEELSYNHIFTDEEHLAIKKHMVKKAVIGFCDSD